MKKMTKKWKWGLLLTLSAAIIGGSITSTTLAAKKEKVSSRASTQIKLDEGTDKEFTVPADATKLIEPTLIGDSNFKGYVQNEQKIDNFSKNQYRVTSSGPLLETYQDTHYIKDNETYLVLGVEHNWAKSGPFNYNTFVSVLDKNGIEKKRTYVDKPFYDGSGTKPIVRLYKLVKEGNTFNIYLRDYRKITFDQNGDIIAKKTLDFKENELFTKYKNYPSYIANNIDNSKTFLTTYIMKAHYSLTSKIRVFPLDFSNSDLYDINTPIELEIPDLTELNENWSSSPGDAYMEISDFSEFVGGYIGKVALQRVVNQSATPVYSIIWDKNGKVIFKSEINDRVYPLNFERTISDMDTLYFSQKQSSTHIETLYKYDISKNKIIPLVEFGKNANISYAKENSKITFFGYMEDFTGPLFSNYTNTHTGIVIGSYSNKIDNLTTFKFNNVLNISNINREQPGMILLTGGMIGESNEVVLDSPNFQNKYDNDNTNTIAISMNDKVDYSPAIKTPEKTININQTIADWDKELLDGIAVHDTYALDPNNISGQKTQTWLEQRINRNPNKIVYESDSLTAKTLPDIDWKALGYDKTKVGPQEVTYFVTDDQSQTTSTTRIINNVTNETTDNRKAQLDAHNFTIPLINVQKGDLATDNAIKKKAKTVAWETDSGTAVEDASADIFSNDKVIFSNKSQVDAIRNATEAKPYPLDIQYKGSSKVTNRIWVFVTADNTVVQNGVVLYADDFKLPLKEAGSSTADSLLKKDKFKDTQPNVVAYDLNAQPQDVKTLPPLSEGKKDGTSKGLSMETNSLQRIKGSTTGGVLTGIVFTYTNPTNKKVTSVKVDVSIEESAEFCFKLERTKEALTFVDLTVDDSVNKNYRSMSIELPSFVKLTTVPSTWTRLPDQTTTSSGGGTRNLYRFNMKSKNTVADIKSFLEGIKMTIASTNVNTPDTVKAYLYEEELLPDAKPKAISKDAVLKSSAVIETGDFGLYTESKWDDDAGRNYVDLQWDKVPNLSDNGYKMYQSVDGNNFEIRSIKYNKAIKVLNIYPDVPDSNTLQGWMDGLGLKDKDGNNLIQVTPVSITDYNADPDKYLKNSQGNYQYDVLMFGSWDGNAALDLNDNSYTATRKFTNTGRGVLFGHDAVHFLNKNFMRFSEDVGVFPLEYPFIDTPSSIQYWTGDDSVTVVDNGYLMKYPFEMEQNQILTIPYSHTIHPRNKHTTTAWLNFTGKSGEFIGGMEDENWINNWYLITKNNFSMTQMGHSNGASTHDERMITANTLYNLAQVGLEENGQDYTVKDDKAPDIVATPTRDMENNVTVEGIDFGKEYYHYVTADTKDKGLLKSDTVKTEVISDLQGYVYVVDESPTTVPNVTKDAYGKVTNITAPVTNPETDRSVTIGGFTKERQYLHIIPVDRANNVGEVKHYKLGDLAYTEEPHQTSCQHNIPQKVYIKGKDILGNALPGGDQVLETKLRNNKKFNFTPNAITNYDYVELKEKATGSVITPEVFTIGSTKQDAEAIYRRKSAKIHIRQQVLSPNETVVIPTQGHASFIGTDALSTGTTKMTVPFNSSDKTDLDFTDYEIEIEDTKTLLSIKDIVPMYYDLKGYVVTNTNKAHTEADMVKEINSIDLLANPEIWVTVYVKPNVTDAAFYGWMYGQTGQYTVSK